MATTFFDANGNYYETLTDRDVPEGHTVAPQKPSGDHTWSGAAWVVPDPDPITPEQVKAEAYQIIIAICPEWKQRNLTAQASILAEKGRANWTADELTAWNAGEAIWQQIAAVRARSDELEAMDPIPLDYDTRWP